MKLNISMNTEYLEIIAKYFIDIERIKLSRKVLYRDINL